MPGDRDSGGERIPIAGIRRRLVDRLGRVQREVPAVTVVEECDFTALDEEHAGEERMALLLKAASSALRDVPELNATVAEDEIAIHHEHHIALAVQTPAGLLAPVVGDVDLRPPSELAAEVERLTAAAKQGRLAPADLRGSTFTVTEAGRFGGVFATPLINSPEVAVLGLHRVDERPVVRDGELAIRRMGNISCTFDHRAVEGFHASAFLLRFAELLRRPGSLAEADDGPASDSELGKRLAGLAPAERAEVARDLVHTHLEALLAPGAPFDPGRAFRDLGLDSAGAVELRNRLARATGLRLPSTLAFDHPTPEAVAERLLKEAHGAPRVVPRPASARPPGPAAAEPGAAEPVAILGIGCRYPGGADTPERLWELVASGTDAISGFPEDRGWDLERLYDPDPDAAGKTYAREGGFLAGAGEFDAGFFGISPREALAMDPQQRLLLETAWEALEDAAIDPTSLRGSRTGVYAGVVAGGYEAGAAGHPELEGMLLTGTTTSVASGRLAYALGLEGPALTVDTACSSSLVALHLACRALRAGECELALAGGATVMASPELFVEFSRQRGLAPNGRCKSFAAAADGTAWAEGAGLVALARLADAQRLGYPIRALVRGSAVGQDGASNGLTAPNGPAQERVVAEALDAAGLGPADVDAVEAHGTGTALGDPVEAEALLSVYGGRRAGEPLWLGSIKSNIGHSSAAAGVAGVIKMTMAMRHGVLPPTLHVDEPTPEVEWRDRGVELLTQARHWPGTGRPRRAGVSSFGISGTNAHLLLEQAPASEPSDDRVSGGGAPSGPTPPLPLLLSAKAQPALREAAARLAAHLEDDPDLELADVAYSLAVAKPAFARRAAVLAGDREQALHGLGALAAGVGAGCLIDPGTAAGDGGLAYLFTGQGSQRVGMGKRLHDSFPVFAAAFDRACEALDPELPESLAAVVFGAHPRAAELLDRTELTQPALFALEVALFRLLESLGIRPAQLTGHSIGEIVAAHVAGVLTLADAARLVAARGRLMGELPAGGAMVAIEASEEELADSIDGRAAELAIAAVNGPRGCVLSGAEEAVEEVAGRWAGRGRRTRRLDVSHAFHSPLIEPMLEAFAEVTAGLDYGRPATPIVSGVYGKALTPEQAADPSYWVRQVRDPVRFADAVGDLAEHGAGVMLELGPDAVLSAAAAASLEGAGATVAPTMRAGGEEPETFVAALCSAHVAGAGVDWSAFFAGSGVARTPLPTYPFQRRRYWVRPAAARDDVAAAGLDAPGHPLLGAAIEDPASGALTLAGRISLDVQPWLADHVVAGEALLPASAFLELAARAAREVGAGQIEELVLEAPLAIPERGGVRVQVSVGEAQGPEGEVRAIEIHSRAERQPDSASEWSCHARGLLSAGVAPAPDPPGEWPPAGAEPIPLERAYQRLAEAGYEYGPAFRGLLAAWRVGEEICAEVALAPERRHEAERFALHPALLDAALHPFLLLADPAGPPAVPFAFSNVLLGAAGASKLRVRLVPAGERVALEARDPAGALACAVGSLASRPLAAGAPGAGPGGALFELAWSEVELSEREAPAAVEVHEARIAAEDDRAATAEAETAALLARLKAFLASERPAEGRLAIVTADAVAIGEDEAPDPAGAALWGLVRSAQAEHPGRFVLVDTDGSEAAAATLPVALASKESQLALRGDRALVPRPTPVGAGAHRMLAPPGEWRMEAAEPGALDGLALVADPAAGEPLAPGQVRVEVRAAGLNFRDVLVALGRYPGDPPLGGEAAGVVVEVGSAVTDLAPGDRVMGLVPGAFASRVLADRRSLVSIPAAWGFREAASAPIAFLTARYALVDLVGLRGGEKILVHAAAGAVGVAAVQLAHHLGAEVFATASEAKWDVLREAGVAPERIASSRDAGFARRFAGEDFDVVLNSLTGQLLDASLGLLGPGGRFVELGKADLRDPDEVAAAHPGASYSAFDLLEAGPDRLGEMLTETLDLFEQGALRHIPAAGYDVSRAPDAFRLLREGRNVGKLVLELPRPLDPEATVLITGGTGALGRLLARHLVERHGARRLLLAGRRGPEAEGAAELRARLEALGAHVSILACDISERAQLERLLDSIPAEHPLGAVFHLAGALDDGTVESLSAERLERALAPKAGAAWLVHRLTEGMDLSHFVFFSSASGALGAPGQGNYAAANSFLDALAQSRRAAGLPAVSIAWGPWAREGGMTARLAGPDLARLRRRGLEPLADADALALFDAALAGPPVSLALHHAPEPPPAPSPQGNGQPDDLTDLEPPERRRALLELVRHEAAAVLGHDSAAAVDPDAAFRDLGFDSLAAVELRNRLRSATGLELDASLVFDHPTAATLAEHLATA